MPDNEKERFREMSKQAKAGGSVNPVFANNTNRPKLNENKPKPQRDIMTSQGILYSEIERRRNAAEEFEKEMKDKISTLIDDGFLNNCKQYRYNILFKLITVLLSCFRHSWATVLLYSRYIFLQKCSQSFVHTGRSGFNTLLITKWNWKEISQYD